MYNESMEKSLDEIMKTLPLRLCTHCNKCNEKLPASPWDEMPDGCGFNGWLFQKREEIKQKIRKLKEELILIEIALKTLSGEPLTKAKARIEEIKDIIQTFAQYDSQNW